MFTLCILLANGVRLLLDVASLAASVTWVLFYRKRGAKVALRSW